MLLQSPRTMQGRAGHGPEQRVGTLAPCLWHAWTSVVSAKFELWYYSGPQLCGEAIKETRVCVSQASFRGHYGNSLRKGTAAGANRVTRERPAGDVVLVVHHTTHTDSAKFQRLAILEPTLLFTL